MRKEYTVTNGASGVDLYPKDKFDSNKTIGVLLREAAGQKPAWQNFSLRSALRFASTLNRRGTSAFGSGLHQAALDQFPIGAIQTVLRAVLDNGLRIHPAHEALHAFLERHFRGKR
jgi:hypothetical protein